MLSMGGKGLESTQLGCAVRVGGPRPAGTRVVLFNPASPH